MVERLNQLAEECEKHAAEISCDGEEAAGDGSLDEISQASLEPENRTLVGVARGGGVDRPPPDPGLLLRSYR